MREPSLGLLGAGLLLLLLRSSMAQPAEQTADDLWTTGPLLQAVQLAPLYSDSKTFVDMPCLTSQADAQAAFQELSEANGGNLTAQQLSAFVNETFGEAGSDLDTYSPPDFQPQPANWLPLVTDPAIRQWALDVHALWAYLSRIENATVGEQPDRHSLLTLASPGVIAGDRFREVYYWDTYWIVLGLLVSRMAETATSVVNNLVELLREYGHVPNGARTYYLNRSQPPLLSQMVRAVYDANSNSSFLETAYEALQTEHAYWTSPPKIFTVAMPGGTFNFSRYYAEWDQPRPESYLEDVQTAEGLSAEDAAELWNNIASGAETGMDFSSRWFADGETMQTIQTSRLIPTDLNALLYQMELNMAYFAQQLGYEDGPYWTALAFQRQAAFNAVLYDQSSGRWLDQVVISTDGSGVSSVQPSTQAYYVSNYLPLWTGIVAQEPQIASAVLDSFLSSGLLQAAGVSTSLNNTGQQWDAPNAWAPLQWFMIQAMQQNGRLQQAASLAQTWLNNNWLAWQQTGTMVEKYSAVTPGLAGGGGEYEVQTGFGWTNGVMLSLLSQYGWNPRAMAPAAAPTPALSS